MQIPLFKPDLPAWSTIDGAFRDIWERGQVSNFGHYCAAFEAAVADYLDVPAVAVSSGTLGLLLALKALDLPPGAKIVVPSFTFMATAQAILFAGGVPLFADVDDDLTLSPVDLAALLDRHPDVAAVVPVHTYGQPCRVDAIQHVVDQINDDRKQPIAVLYDAAHAFGAQVGTRRVGSFGSAEVFSLSGTKPLVSIEGGLIASCDQALLHRVRKLRNYGIAAHYDAHWPGLNGKMSELHAAVGLHNLQQLDTLLAERQRKAAWYRHAIETRTGFTTLPCRSHIQHTFKDMTILVPELLTPRRDQIRSFLTAHGIETRTYFSPPVHQQRLFRPYADRPLPRTAALAARVLNIPFFASITAAEMEAVVTMLQQAEQALG